jgi:hypothetical protein
MFEYTRVAIKKIIDDIKKFVYTFHFSSHLFMIAYLVYSLIMQKGVLWLDIPMLAVCLAYFVFFLVVSNKRKDKSKKKLYATLENIFQRSKLVIRFFSIAVLVYGMCITIDQVSHFAIITLALSVIGWILAVLLEIIQTIIEKKCEFIIEAFQADIEPITNFATKTGNFFKKISGQETTPTPSNTPPTKNRELLDKLVDEFREEKANAKVAKKQAKKEARLARIQAKKEARAQAIAERKSKTLVTTEIATTTNSKGKKK